MNKHFFYSHLVEVESLIIELDKFDLSIEQKKYLTNLIDSSLHHIILDAVLSELKPTDKKVFLNHLKEDNERSSPVSRSQIWQFLNEKVDSVEEKIKKAAVELTKELHKDLKVEKGS